MGMPQSDLLLLRFEALARLKMPTVHWLLKLGVEAALLH